MHSGSLGFEASPFVEPPSVAAVESSPQVGGLAVVGAGAGETVVDLTLVEKQAERVGRRLGLLPGLRLCLAALRRSDPRL